MTSRKASRDFILAVLVLGLSASLGHCQGLPQIIGQLARGLHDSDAAKREVGKRLAVIQFSADAGDEAFAAFIRASIQDRFESSKRFRLVTPEQLTAGYQRLGGAPGGILNNDDIHKLGAEIAADLVVVGEISAKGGGATVTGRLVAVATGELLASSTVEITKALIPDQYLSAADQVQFKPPAFHPLHPDEPFQIAALCRTLLPVDLQALKAAVDGKIGKLEIDEAGSYARITYDEKSPVVSWVSIRGGLLLASSGSSRDLAAFHALDTRLMELLEAVATLSGNTSKERRLQLLCFHTMYFVDQPEGYLRGILGYSDLRHFVMSGSIYFPPELKINGIRATSLHRGWDGGFGFTFDGAELAAKTAKVGETCDFTALATPGTHRWEASTYLASQMSGPQPGIGLLEISCEPSEKPLKITIGKGPDIFWVPIGPISDVVAKNGLPTEDAGGKPADKPAPPATVDKPAAPADKPGEDNSLAKPL